MNRNHQDPPEPRPGLHPADLADRLQRHDPDEARAVLRGLPPDMAGFFFFLGLATLSLPQLGR